MEIWERHRLGELVSINVENINKEYPFDNIYYFDISSVGSGEVYDIDAIELASAPSRAKRLVQEGSTIVATVRPGNRSFYFFSSPRPNDVVSTGFAVIKPNVASLHAKFLYYLVTDYSFTNYLVSVEKGANYPAVTAADIGKASVLIPPFSTQKKIAYILSAYDNLIENNLKRIKLLEELAQITYEQWFVRMKFSGYETTAIHAETGLPEGWEYKRLDEVFDFSNGHAFYTKGYSDTGYDVIDLGNISTSSDLLISGNEKKISDELYEQSSKFHLQKFDVVVAMTDMTKELGILAKSAIIDKDNKYVLNQRVGRLRPREKYFDYSFIHATLNDPRFIKTMHSVSKGAVQFYYNTKDIINYQVVMPSAEIINNFQNVYKPYLETRLLLKAQNTLLSEARNILLPRLMAGMIDVDYIELPSVQSDMEEA